jgi:hypothetical protein
MEVSVAMSVKTLLQAVHSRVRAVEIERKAHWETEAPDFNSCSFIVPRPKERHLTDVLAQLLDPEQPHGQKERFLNLFLKLVGAGWQGTGAKVFCERRGEGGQPDIFVKMPGGILMIENKLQAGDQPEQIRRYIERCENERQPWRLAYLTPSGKEPTSLTADELKQHLGSGTLRLLSYESDITKWLEECLAQCKAKRASAFIQDLIVYIRTNVMGRLSVEANEHVIEEAVSSVETVEAAMEVIAAAEDIQARSRNELQEQLVRELGDPCWAVRVPAESEGWTGFYIDFPSGSPLKFCIQWYDGRLQYGILRQDEMWGQDMSPQEKELVGKISLELGSATQD